MATISIEDGQISLAELMRLDRDHDGRISDEEIEEFDAKPDKPES
jgi:hypothetical protein